MNRPATRTPHRIHKRTTGQLDWRPVIGVAVPRVEPPGALVGGLEVRGDPDFLVEYLMIRAQERDAGTLALPVWPHREHGQVMMADPDRMPSVERRVEPDEAIERW